jgi:hypothetical protein
MVLYGDSHAAMWFQALDAIAKRAHWKLVVLTKSACLAASLPTQAPGLRGDWVACDRWHRFAINRINQIDPELLIVSQAATYPTPDGIYYSASQLGNGLRQMLKQVTGHTTKDFVIGNIPSSGGPSCLASHPDDVQACSSSPRSALTPANIAEKQAVAAVGGRYVDVTPWFCAKTCSAVIGDYDVYLLGNHVAVGYSIFLEGVLAEALGLSTPT